jgi:hypothetical protein
MPRHRPPRAALLALLGAPFLLGCGATTVRAAIGPTLDSQGKVGVETTFGVGIGTPVDFRGRSHHFLQVMPSLGGGLDGRTREGVFRLATDVDYIYWAGSNMDIRGGMRLSYRTIPSVPDAPGFYGFGGHFAFLPVVKGDEGGWLVTHFCIGPELQLEYLWSDPAGISRSLISLPLVFDLTFLGAGD